jgi:hypothetical protein
VGLVEDFDTTRLYAPKEIAELLTAMLLGQEVKPERVRDWFRNGRSPAGPLVPDQKVGGVSCLTGDSVARLAGGLTAAGWHPARRGRPTLRRSNEGG